MQPLQPRYDRPESDKIQPAKPRIPRSKREQTVSLLTSVRFWSGLSGLIALVSLTLPWWGVTIQPYGASWGLFFGPQSTQTNVVFFQDRLDTALASNYTQMTGLVLLTALTTAIGAGFRRRLILTISLIVSAITVLSFLVDVGNALTIECQRTLVGGGSCISGLVGQGASGLNTITWGFEVGFYAFIVSAVLLLVGTLALQWSKS